MNKNNDNNNNQSKERISRTEYRYEKRNRQKETFKNLLDGVKSNTKGSKLDLVSFTFEAYIFPWTKRIIKASILLCILTVAFIGINTFKAVKNGTSSIIPVDTVVEAVGIDMPSNEKEQYDYCADYLRKNYKTEHISADQFDQMVKDMMAERFKN